MKLPEIKKQKIDQMDPMMRAIKAVHSAGAGTENLARARAEMELFSKLVTPYASVTTQSFTAGNVPCEIATPSFPYRKDKIILYCHGGGYTCGGLSYARILANKMAVHVGLPVVSFEYRLAPENPYPAAIEDATCVWDYLMHKGYGAKEIILAGDSAGGNLCLELVLLLKDKGRILPKAMILMSPWTDMRAKLPSYKNYKDKDPLLTYEYVLSVREAYAGKDADFSLPQYSPLMADLTDFPPALIQVGSNEILRSDSEQLEKKLIKSGCFARIEIYSGGWHVFQQMPILKARRALDNMSEFVRSL